MKNQLIVDNTEIDETATILENVYIYGKCKIGKGTIIYPNSTLIDCDIGDNCQIISSVIENSQIKNNVKIGPFAHVRPGSIIEDDCRIGNFVEVKNAHLKKGTKANHLAYIGDAEVGKNCNIGCGVIFANYNGKIKQKIIVGDNCFIGSNSNLVAPIKIAKNSYICAGTTLTKDTKENDFIVGRCREIVKSNRAQKYLKDV